MQEITISPKNVAKYLFLIISGLLTLHIIGQVAKFGFGSNQLYGFVPLFFMGGESNIPAFYSSAAIFTCAVLLFVIGVVRSRVRSGDHLHWLGLALIFVFLSMDEALRFHERLLGPMHNLFGDTHVAHITLNEQGEPVIDEIVEADTVREMMEYVQYTADDMQAAVEQRISQARENEKLTEQEAADLLEFYRAGLNGYTYLE